MLSINNLSKSFHEHCILQELSLETKIGEVIAIVGRSGSGKSTLLSLISGIQVPDCGEIIFDGKSIENFSLDERTKFRSEYIGTIFQDFKLIDHLTVFENIALPMQLKKMDNIQERVEEVLDYVELAHRTSAFPATLSGGEKQRVAIARAMGMQAKLVLADEPNANLDIETGENVMNCLFDLSRKLKQTMILVTHDVELSKQCDRVYQLINGRLERA